MPQLDIFAFSSEVFWLLLFVGGFFYLFLTYLLPNLLFILKIREARIKSLDVRCVVSTSPAVKLRTLVMDTNVFYSRVLGVFDSGVLQSVDEASYALFYVYKMTELNVHFNALVQFLLNIKTIVAADRALDFLADVVLMAGNDNDDEQPETGNQSSQSSDLLELERQKQDLMNLDAHGGWLIPPLS